MPGGWRLVQYQAECARLSRLTRHCDARLSAEPPPLGVVCPS